MQSSRKPPTGESIDSSRSGWRNERKTSPPLARRDDRTEPDDESASATRVEVVKVDGAGRDIANAGVVALRRELAKLHQHAAALEKLLEEQRRDRSDSLDRLERATERVLLIEARLASAEAETASVRKTHDMSLAELRVVRAERDELTLLVVAAKKSTADLEDVNEELRRVNTELAKVRANAAKTSEEVTTARAALANATEELTRRRAKLATLIEELAKLRDEVAQAKADNSRDRATARDRIDLLERALDDARAATVRTETQLDAVRSNEERLGRQRDMAQEAASEAESRASTTAMALAALELSVRRLREEIAEAFARVGSSATDRVVSVVPSDTNVALDARVDGARGSGVAASSSVFKSAPPRAFEALAAAAPQGTRGSMPPPTYASLRPQPHDSKSPGFAARQTMPPPSAHRSMVAAARGWSSGRSSSPPSGPSTMPPTTRGSRLPGRMESIPPAANPPGTPTAEALVSQARARHELLAKLADPESAEEAAMELAQRPEWLRGAPPPALVAALSNLDYKADGKIFDLSRVWEREPLCHALLAALRSEPSQRLREHSAWLLKHFVSPASWKLVAELAKSDEETEELRRWLLEGLERLAAGRAIGWAELGDVLTVVSRHRHASLREGVVGILRSLDPSEDKRRLLLDILRNDDDETVLASAVSAVNALGSVLAEELDLAAVTRLLEYPSLRVQRGVRELMDRTKQGDTAF